MMGLSVGGVATLVLQLWFAPEARRSTHSTSPAMDWEHTDLILDALHVKSSLTLWEYQGPLGPGCG